MTVTIIRATVSGDPSKVPWLRGGTGRVWESVLSRMVETFFTEVSLSNLKTWHPCQQKKQAKTDKSKNTISVWPGLVDVDFA